MCVCVCVFNVEIVCVVQITSVSVSPTDDTFISAATDSSVLTWDIRSCSPTGRLQLPAPASSIATIDTFGLVFAVALSPSEVKLFDVRKASQGPFDQFKMASPQDSSFVDCK